MCGTQLPVASSSANPIYLRRHRERRTVRAGRLARGDSSGRQRVLERTHGTTIAVDEAKVLSTAFSMACVDRVRRVRIHMYARRAVARLREGCGDALYPRPQPHNNSAKPRKNAAARPSRRARTQLLPAVVWLRIRIRWRREPPRASPARSSTCNEKGVRLAQKMQVGPRIPVGIQLLKAEVGPSFSLSGW
jgi:hypothetical protein